MLFSIKRRRIIGWVSDDITFIEGCSRWRFVTRAWISFLYWVITLCWRCTTLRCCRSHLSCNLPHNNSVFIWIKSSKYVGTRSSLLPAVATGNPKYDFTKGATKDKNYHNITAWSFWRVWAPWTTDTITALFITRAIVVVGARYDWFWEKDNDENQT